MEQRLLLVPVYGFGSMEQAVSYRNTTQDQRWTETEKTIFYNQGHAKYYVPIPDGGGLPTIGLMEVARVLAGERRFILRRRQDAKPPGAYMAIMLMFGAKRFDYVCRDQEAPSWVRRVSSGARDCFVAWLRSDGLPHHRITLRSTENEELDVHIVRGARGMVYTRRPVLGERGHIEGFASRVVGLSLSVFDKHPDKDDVLSWQMFSLDDQDWPVAQPAIRLGHKYDQVWHGLAAQALGGFKQECTAWPVDAETKRRLVMTQQAWSRADARLPSQSGFYELVNQVSWQDALRLVEEPWQMEVVCRVYGEWRNHHGNNGARLPTEVISALIDKTDFSEERRAELRGLLEYPSLVLPVSQTPLRS